MLSRVEPRAWTQLDTNGDGRIEPKELNEGLRKLGIAVDITFEDAKRLIAFFDDNNDGSMDAYEFLEFVLKGTVGHKIAAEGSSSKGAKGATNSTGAAPASPTTAKIATVMRRERGDDDDNDDDFFATDEDASEYDDAFQAARAAVRRKWSRADDLERLREYLRRKDFASDGTIKERVFLRFLRASRISAELSDTQISRLVTALDTKGDQWIDYKAFTRRVIDRAAEDLDRRTSLGYATSGRGGGGGGGGGGFHADPAGSSQPRRSGGGNGRHASDLSETLRKVMSAAAGWWRYAPFSSRPLTSDALRIFSRSRHAVKKMCVRAMLCSIVAAHYTPGSRVCDERRFPRRAVPLSLSRRRHGRPRSLHARGFRVRPARRARMPAQ